MSGSRPGQVPCSACSGGVNGPVGMVSSGNLRLTALIVCVAGPRTPLCMRVPWGLLTLVVACVAGVVCDSWLGVAGGCVVCAACIRPTQP